MAGQVVLGRVGFKLLQRPIGKRIEAEPAFEELDSLHLGALACLEPLASRDLRCERFKRALERNDLAEVAAGIGVLRPQYAFRFEACAIGRVRGEGTDIAET